MATSPKHPLVTAAKTLRKDLADLQFSEPVTHVYNPLEYAWRSHQSFLQRYGAGTRKIVFLGMNPGPWGMAQTGVPFGEIEAVRDWMGISEKVDKPSNEHPKRPIEGFDCTRSEVSGRRLWGWAHETFGPADAFFEKHFVLNFCPLVFMEEGGKNRTPDKLPADEIAPVDAACIKHLRQALHVLQPEWAIGVGAYAEKKLEEAIGDSGPRIGRILHPSPASPAANKGWAEAASRQMTALGAWD